LSIEEDGETKASFCFNALEELIRVPEDFACSRDPREKLAVGDWLEVGGQESDICAIVRRITRDRVHYLEASSMSQLSVPIEQWRRWADSFPLHARYERNLPGVILRRILKEHRDRGLLDGMSAGGDSNLILDILADYGYYPNDWELENGYWAEELVDQAIEKEVDQQRPADNHPDDGSNGRNPQPEIGGVSFSSAIPTIDDFKW